MTSKKIVLVDMDGTLADFDRKLLELLKKKYPDYKWKPLNERVHPTMNLDYPEEMGHAIREIYHTRGFYENLNPIEGAINALFEMEKYFSVFICSSPLVNSPFNLQEKHAWVYKLFGKAWLSKLILSTDKTLIHGDYFIDDQYDIHGICKPTWELILYDQPQNRSQKQYRRLTWKTWREVLAF